MAHMLSEGHLQNQDQDDRFDINDNFYIDYEQFRVKRQAPPPDVEEPEHKEYFLVPLYAITGFFAALLFLGPLFVRRGPYRGIIQSSIMLTAFSMWIFWFTIYFGQMNPLMGPRLENTTVAWIAYKLGDAVGNYT